jgi:hypothetical protein
MPSSPPRQPIKLLASLGQLQFNLSRLLTFEHYQQQPALFEIQIGFGQTVALDAFATAQRINRTPDCC